MSKRKKPPAFRSLTTRDGHAISGYRYLFYGGSWRRFTRQRRGKPERVSIYNCSWHVGLLTERFTPWGEAGTLIICADNDVHGLTLSRGEARSLGDLMIHYADTGELRLMQPDNRPLADKYA